MRIGSCLPALRVFSLFSLAAGFSGCATSGSEIQTSSLAPRPSAGLRTDAPGTYTAETVSPRPYMQPGYSPPAYEPRPNVYARNDMPSAPGQQHYAQAYTRPPQNPYAPAQPYYGAQQPYPPPQRFAAAGPGYGGYGQSPYGAGPNSGIQTGSLGRPPQPAAPVPAVPYQQQGRPLGAQVTTGSIGSAPSPRMVEVREGDTLFSLSKKTGVPVKEIVAANHLNGEKIQIGQKLTIPTATR